jgi:hypothetical protein
LVRWRALGHAGGRAARVADERSQPMSVVPSRLLVVFALETTIVPEWRTRTSAC